MREFKLLRYFKKWWWLVVLCSVLGGAFFCKYILDSQTYVAQTMLAYTNTEAEQGLTPNGAEIDPNEILSSWVVSQALEGAGISESVDRVRSRLSTAEVVPDDVAAVQKAAWADGLEYDYFPTEYIISYKTGTDSSPDEAREILESVMDSYYHYYGQQYVNTALAPASIYSLLAIEYDPIELVEALDTYVEELLTFTTNNASFSPDFRSAQTGYGFENLVSEYTLFQDSTLPMLYAQVIGSRASRDRSALLMKYQTRIADNELQITNLETRATDIQGMIDAYVAKNQQSMDYHWGQQSADGTDQASSTIRGQNYVLGQVYEYAKGDYASEQTTYDKLLLQYVSNNDAIETLKLDNTYCEYILNAYRTAAGTNEASADEALAALDEACATLAGLEDILTTTVSEYMGYRAAQNLAIRSTVNVSSTVNTKLYIALAVVLFFLVGCIGAVLLGRGQDFVEYALYVDHTSGLPNRKRCDEVLEQHSQKPVMPPFSCVCLRIDNLSALNLMHGYSGGTQAIAAMGRMLSLCAEDFGFVGYNDSAQFIGVFENCAGARADYFLAVLHSAVETYNGDNPDRRIEYRAYRASLEAGEVGTARDLLRSCIAQLAAKA